MLTISSNPVASKVCCACGIEKSLSEFPSKNRKEGTLRSRCKPCMNAYYLARYYANPEPHKKRCMAWAKVNREKSDAIHRNYVERNRVKLRDEARANYHKRRDQRAAYRKANAERIKVRNAEYRKRKAAEIKASGRVYYLANKDEINVRIRKAIAAKPELYQQLHKAAKHRRRVRLESNGPLEKFTDHEIFERDGWVCGLCDKPVDPSLNHPDPMSASLDHRQPIAKGGGHTRANVQCAHLRCNLSKRDRIGIRAA